MGRKKGSKNKVKAKTQTKAVEPIVKEEVKQQRRTAFKCENPKCNYEIFYRQYKGIDKDDAYEISQTALNAIIEGCPKCKKISKKIRDYVMKVTPRKPIQGKLSKTKNKESICREADN